MKYLHIHGRRWFDRNGGNTYHSVEVFIDGDRMHKIDYAYGYGYQFEETAKKWLSESGHLPGLEGYGNGGQEMLSRYCWRMKIKYICDVTDVGRKKDL